MELREYLTLLRKWAWLIALCVLLAAGAAYVVSSRQPPTYQATVTLLVNQASSTTQDYTAILTGERLARTYAQMLTKRPVMAETAQQLGLNVSPEDLAKKVEVRLVRDTQLITLQVLDSDPSLAMRIANKIPEVFSIQNEQLQRSRYASSKENLQKQMEAVASEIAAAERTLESLRTASELDQLEISRLTEELLQYRNTYANLLRSYEEIRLAEARTLDTVTVVESADIPTVPVGPKTMTNTVLAGIVGAMLAVGVAFLVEYLDDTVKTDADVAAVLGLPTLGGVAAFRESDSSVILADQSQSPVLENFRVLRTNIRFSSPDRPPKTLLVTSALEGEGKTTTVANLGVAFARAGATTVIVDADLRKPRLHKVFKLDNRTGLTTSLISDDVQRLNGSLKESGIPALKILASGPCPPNPSEMLSSERMEVMIRQLATEADVVLLDSAPCLVVSDPSVLASKVDGIVLVIESGKTRREAAVRAKQTLERVGGRILGVVLTKVPLRKHGYGYYHYRYYNYRSNGDDERS